MVLQARSEEGVKMADAGSSFFPTFNFSAWWDNFVSGGDTPGQAAVRARGIDPTTGKIIAPQYEKSLGAQGLDVNDPTAVSKYADQVAAAEEGRYQAEAARNFRELGGLSFWPFSPVVGGDAKNPFLTLTKTEKIVLVIVIVAVIFLLVMN